MRRSGPPSHPSPPALEQDDDTSSRAPTTAGAQATRHSITALARETSETASAREFLSWLHPFTLRSAPGEEGVLVAARNFLACSCVLLARLAPGTVYPVVSVYISLCTCITPPWVSCTSANGRSLVSSSCACVRAHVCRVCVCVLHGAPSVVVVVSSFPLDTTTVPSVISNIRPSLLPSELHPSRGKANHRPPPPVHNEELAENSSAGRVSTAATIPTHALCSSYLFCFPAFQLC